MGVVIYLAKPKRGRKRHDPLVLAFQKLHRDIAAMTPIIDRIEAELTREAPRQKHKGQDAPVEKPT